MPRSSRPRKTQSLSGSLQRRLNAYALAASATGAALFALAPPSEAEIVYTPAKGMVTRNVPFTIDLNGDGTIDFTIIDHAKGTSLRSQQFLDVSMPQGNAVMCDWVACSSGFSFAAALLGGVKIGTSYYAWMSRRALMAFEDNSRVDSRNNSFSYGSWAHRSVNPPRYLGLQFLIDGETHFGWARLNLKFRKSSPRTWEAHVTGYAYETIANKPIYAGQIRENDDDTAVRPEPSRAIHPAALRRLAPSASSRFATLGALALGVDGMTLWRREETNA